MQHLSILIYIRNKTNKSKNRLFRNFDYDAPPNNKLQIIYPLNYVISLLLQSWVE